MLETLAQVQNEDGTVTFKNAPQNQTPQYNSEDPDVIDAVIKGLEQNSPSILSVAFYTRESAQYIDDKIHRINLIVDSKEDLTRMLKAVETNTHLTELLLCGYKMTYEPPRPKMQVTEHIEGNKITYRQTPVINKPEEEDEEILEANDAEKKSYALGEVVANNPSLRTLRLYYMQLSYYAVWAFGWGIEYNTKISSLYLSESTFFNGIKPIAEALKKNHFITHMDITNIKDPNNIGARIMPIFADLAGGSGTTLEINKSLSQSLGRNREFAKQCAALEEKFWALVRKKVIPEILVATKESINSVQAGIAEAIEEAEKMREELAIEKRMDREILDIAENARVCGFSTLQDVEEIKKDTDKVKRIGAEKRKKLRDIELIHEEKKRSEIIYLLEEMLDIVDKLKNDGYSAAGTLLHRVKCAEAEFYFSIDQVEQLFALERDYFVAHPDANFDFQLAEKIFAIDDAVTLRSLGLGEVRLKYQYILHLLEDNQTPGANNLCKSAYLRLHGLHDAHDDQSFEKAIGVDRILTNDEFQKLRNASSSNNNVFKLFYQIVQIAKDIGQISSTSSASSASSTSSEKIDLKELLETLSAPDKLSVEQILIPMFEKKEKPDLKHLLNLLFDPKKFTEEEFPKQEKFAAQVLIDVFEEKKVAVYAQLRQKSANEPVKMLNLTGASNTLNVNEFIPFQETDLRLKPQVYLKHTLAQSFADGVYANVFASSSAENITWEHSRILSATRLATLSSKFTYAQIVNILQIEYAALPDDDKKDSASFFTSYRHRTLEKALEKVFDKEKIPFLDKSEIEKDEQRQLAFKIFQWIGEQERSFYYKISKNQTLFTSMQVLGNLAHEIIACDKTNVAAFTTLKNSVQAEINKISSHVDIRSLELAMIKSDQLDLEKRMTTLEKFLGLH